MEASSINTLTGTTDARPRKDGAVVDTSGAFQEAMGEAGGAATGKKADLIDKDSTKKSADKAKEQVADKKPNAGKVPERLSDQIKASQRRDPALMSMVEKAALRGGELSSGKPGGPGQALAQMLAAQGINVSGFSPEQIKGLMARMSTKDLGEMLSGMKTESGSHQKLQEDKQTKDLKEKVAQAAKGTGAEQPAFQLEQFVEAGVSKGAGDTARAEQRRQVLDQILAQIDVKNVANQTEMNLRLNPEYLGEVKISLVHDDEGGVRASFKTTSRATREVLADNTEDLIGQARDKGVRIGSMSVQLVDSIEA